MSDKRNHEEAFICDALESHCKSLNATCTEVDQRIMSIQNELNTLTTKKKKIAHELASSSELLKSIKTRDDPLPQISSAYTMTQSDIQTILRNDLNELCQ